MDLAALRTRGGVTLGLHLQRSTDIVDLTTCLVLHPRLVALMPPLRALLTRLQALRREASRRECERLEQQRASHERFRKRAADDEGEKVCWSWRWVLSPRRRPIAMTDHDDPKLTGAKKSCALHRRQAQ
jgi:hypothetical protein